MANQKNRLVNIILKQKLKNSARLIADNPFPLYNPISYWEWV